jgi:hypothetical protein
MNFYGINGNKLKIEYLSYSLLAVSTGKAVTFCKTASGWITNQQEGCKGEGPGSCQSMDTY